jgi:hypothetical protein
MLHPHLPPQLPRRTHACAIASYNLRVRLSHRAIFLIFTACVFTGCVERTLSITSSPPGALLWLNGREVGRTPIDVDFLYYGEYDVQLVADGHEPLLTSGKANPPWWDSIPFDLFAEIIPGERESRIAWHYDLQPRNDDPQALVDRAQQLRQHVEATQPASMPSSETP